MDRGVGRSVWQLIQSEAAKVVGAATAASARETRTKNTVLPNVGTVPTAPHEDDMGTLVTTRACCGTSGAAAGKSARRIHNFRQRIRPSVVTRAVTLELCTVPRILIRPIAPIDVDWSTEVSRDQVQG